MQLATSPFLHRGALSEARALYEEAQATTMLADMRCTRLHPRRIHHSRTRYLASQLLSITTAIIIININTITITPCVAELNGGN